MGRLNLTAINVRKTALANLKARPSGFEPSWFDVVHEVPPAQILIRQQPARHPLTKTRTRTLPDGRTEQYTQTVEPKKPKSAKARRVFSPRALRYEEDSLRKTFFSDHPWELARPRVVVETSGDQYKGADWSRGLQQPGIPLSGESVVQRQLWLLENTADITIPQAYDIARKEFYALRRREERRERIAAEEARHMGARFGKSANQVALGVENAMYNDWEAWSRQFVSELSSRVAAFEGTVASAEEDVLKENLQGEDTGLSQRGADVFALQGQRDAQTHRRAETPGRSPVV